MSMQKLFSGRAVLVSLGAWLGYSVCFFVFGPYAGIREQAGADLPEERFGYSGEQLEGFLVSLGDAGAREYLLFQGLDLVNGLLMGWAFFCLLAWIVKRVFSKQSIFRIVTLLPIFVGLTEVVENSVLAASASGVAEAGTVGGIGGVVTMLKMGATFVLMPIVIVGLVAVVVKIILGRKRRNADSVMG